MHGLEIYQSINFVPIEEQEQNQPKCGFCLIPHTKTTEYFQYMYGSLPHILKIPKMLDSWTVLQDVVPIAEQGGHLLIMPNKHYLSLATVEDQRELGLVRSFAVEALKKFFSNPIFTFEHGPGFVENEHIACGGCHLDHAHGHLLLLPDGTLIEPIKTQLEKKLLTSGWDSPINRGVYSQNIFTDINNVAGINPYLQIGMINKDEKTCSFTYVQRSRSENLESQLMRHIISEIVYKEPNASNWHWKDITSGMVSPNKLRQLRRDVAEFRQITGY